ncbi:MAG: DMT family transporter [Treponema sp.]|nr:DMT family transporter [Treponema sp.]
MNKNVIGALLTLGGGACWGLSGCVGQYLFTRQGMTSLWLVPIRLGCAGIILLTYYLCTNPSLVLDVWKTKSSAVRMIVYGLCGISCCQFLYFFTIQLSNAGTATIIQNVSPVIILAVICLQERRLPRVLEIVAIVLAVGGVFMLTTHGNPQSMVLSPAALISGLGCASCVVIYTMTPGQLQKKYPTPLLQGWAFLMGGIAFALLFQPWKLHYIPSFLGVLGILFVILIGNVLAFNLYMTGLTYIGPEKASLYSFAEPVTAAIISSTFLGSQFTLWDAAGFVCIFLMLVGLFINSMKNA